MDAVLRHLDIAPAHIVETEEPDFLFDLNSTMIGAEVTELYLPSSPDAALPEQARENEERMIVEMARQQAIQKRVPSQLLQLRLSRNCLTKEQRHSVAAEICDFVAKNFAHPGKAKSFEYGDLPRSIVHITLYGQRDTPHTWNGQCSGWMISNFATGFQNAIDKKELLRKKYLSRCDEVWLIMVATHSGGSSFIEWSPELAVHQFCTEFKRVFFVEGLSNNVSELQVTASTAEHAD